MKRIHIGLISILLLTVLLISSCAPAAQSTTADTSAGAALDGKMLVESYCGKCHSLDVVKSEKGTESEWSSTVTRMIGKGLQVTDAEKAAMISYLAATYK